MVDLSLIRVNSIRDLGSAEGDDSCVARDSVRVYVSCFTGFFGSVFGRLLIMLLGISAAHLW